MAKVIAFAIEVAGSPIVKGGAKNALTAFERLIRDQGGEILVGADVDRVFPMPAAVRAAYVSPVAARSRRRKA